MKIHQKSIKIQSNPPKTHDNPRKSRKIQENPENPMMLMMMMIMMIMVVTLIMLSDVKNKQIGLDIRRKNVKKSSAVQAPCDFEQMLKEVLSKMDLGPPMWPPGPPQWASQCPPGNPRPPRAPSGRRWASRGLSSCYPSPLLRVGGIRPKAW